MKKIFKIILCISMALCLVSCNSTNNKLVEYLCDERVLDFDKNQPIAVYCKDFDKDNEFVIEDTEKMKEVLDVVSKLTVKEIVEEYEDDPIYEINILYDNQFDYFDLIINRDGTLVAYDVAYKLTKPMLITEYFEK